MGDEEKIGMGGGNNRGEDEERWGGGMRGRTEDWKR